MTIPAIHVSQARSLGTDGRLSHLDAEVSAETRLEKGIFIPGQSYWLVGMALTRITNMTRLLKENEGAFPSESPSRRVVEKLRGLSLQKLLYFFQRTPLRSGAGSLLS